MRLFFAVMIPETFRASVAQVQTALRERLPAKGISWVKPENFHYTVRFLGEQPESKLLTVQEAAQEAVDGFQVFTLQVGGLGVFPNLQHPRVVWMGTESGEEAFTDLYRRLENALRKRNFPPGPKDFHAHLTLARMKSHVPALSQALETIPVPSMASFEVNRLSLMRSELHSSGSKYTELFRWEF